MKLYWKIIGACFLVLLFIELWLQGIEPTYSPDTHYFPRPYTLFSGKPFSTSTVSEMGTFELNELGFRFQKPEEGKKRIAVIGGSTVFNGIPEELQRLVPNADVMNFGAASYVSGQELSLLVHTIVEYKPDLIIVYDGANDLSLPYGGDPRPGYPHNFAAFETGFRLLSGDMSVNQIVGMLLNKSAIVRMFFGRMLQEDIIAIDSLRDETDYLSENWKREVVESYIRNIEKMCTIGGAFGAKVIVFFQPVRGLEYSTESGHTAIGGLDPFALYMAEQYNRVREHQIGCAFYNLSDIFDSTEYYWDFVHTNKEGNRIIVEKMYEVLQDQNLL